MPHPIREWEPVFDAAVWRKVAEAEAALQALAAHEGAASAAWLLSRAEAASSSIIESVCPSARGLAAVEAGLSIPGDEPFWDDEEPCGPELETLRHALVRCPQTFVGLSLPVTAAITGQTRATDAREGYWTPH